MSKWYPCIYCTEDLHCTKYSDDDCESWCVLDPCTAETPSNGDKIRRMTDEELAEWIANEIWKAFAQGAGNPFFNQEEAVKLENQEWLDWLKQEADNGEN